MFKNKSRSSLVLAVSLIIAILITALALPAMAASNPGGNKPGPGPGPDQGGTHIQGTAAGTITVTPASGSAVTLGMPSETVNATYNLTDTTYTLIGFRVAGTAPTPGATPTRIEGTRLQGTAGGMITVTPTSGTAVSLTMPSGTVEVLYTTADSSNTLVELRVCCANPGPGPGPDQEGNRIEGTAVGAITVTPESGDAVTLEMPADAVCVTYNLTDDTYILRSLRVAGTAPEPGEAPAKIEGTHLQGTASGTIEVTPESGDAITLEMPSGAVDVYYTTADGANTIRDLKLKVEKPSVTPPKTPTITPTTPTSTPSTSAPPSPPAGNGGKGKAKGGK
jgi:hypothetical protein